MARKRRGRSEGSIFQRADGQWVGSVSLGYDGNGKRKRRTVYGATKAEVQEKVRKLQTDAAAGQLADAGNLTVAQYLARWLENTHRPKVQPTTYSGNEPKVRLQLIPHLGQVKLAKMTALHVEQLYVAMERAGDSPQQRHKCGKILRTALRHAVAVGLIPANPALKVPLPKSPKTEMHALDAEQAARFLKAAETDRLYALYVLALDSGMRQGELFALQWADFDFAAGSVQVQRSLEEVRGHLRLKEVKTAQARRRIHLSRFAQDALHEHRKRMLAEGHAGGPVFCDTEGGWLRKSNLVRYWFHPALARAGLPRIRFHDLRHTCATLLLLADVNVKVVSERLGHSTIQMTLDTYSHVLPTMQQKAAEKLDGIFGGASRRAADG
jgi:integrase